MTANYLSLIPTVGIVDAVAGYRNTANAVIDDPVALRRRLSPVLLFSSFYLCNQYSMADCQLQVLFPNIVYFFVRRLACTLWATLSPPDVPLCFSGIILSLPGHAMENQFARWFSVTSKRIGAQTAAMAVPPSVLSFACVGGRLEGKGPLGPYFDSLAQDSFFGEKTWEQAESAMQRLALETALKKAGLTAVQLDCALAGDLLNQCAGSSFALRSSGIPLYGLYGACATMGEALSLGAKLIDGGFAVRAAALTSSHFCTAERQYRTPLPYGSQRPPTAQWTATAAGCTILSAEGPGPYITHTVCGRIVDKGITDAANMGAAMAAAAYDTLCALFRETGTAPGDYDLILTGDLGAVGRAIVAELLRRDGCDPGERYTDCGLLLYDRGGQDMHAGASGCGCSAAVLNGYLLRGMREGRWRRVVFAPTGALLSPTSSLQGQSIPGICHAVVLDAEPRAKRAADPKHS
jgi:stage V sporulation protein AD